MNPSTRRDFNASLLKLSAASVLLPHLEGVSFADSSAIHELYNRSIVIDTLCAPFVDMESTPDSATFEAVRNSGITAINCTVSTPDMDGTLENLGIVQKLADDHPDIFAIVRRTSDIARCKQEHKIGIMLGFQYTQFLEEAPKRIRMFRNLDVRIMQLTYNRRSKFGDGCLEPENRGLTKDGIEAVKIMNEIGVAVDLSHSGYQTTSDAIVQSSKPVLITHSGCAAVYAHPRSKPDSILKALADRGGYFGVYLMPYLVASPTIPTHEQVLDHMVHAINVCGSDHVGIGSDGAIQKTVITPEQKAAFDKDVARRKAAGVSAPGEDRFPYVPDLNGPDHMEVIADQLAKRGQPASVIEKVLGANFQRIIGEIWGN